MEASNEQPSRLASSTDAAGLFADVKPLPGWSSGDEEGFDGGWELTQ